MKQILLATDYADVDGVYLPCSWQLVGEPVHGYAEAIEAISRLPGAHDDSKEYAVVSDKGTLWGFVSMLRAFNIQPLDLGLQYNYAVSIEVDSQEIESVILALAKEAGLDVSTYRIPDPIIRIAEKGA